MKNPEYTIIDEVVVIKNGLSFFYASGKENNPGSDFVSYCWGLNVDDRPIWRNNVVGENVPSNFLTKEKLKQLAATNTAAWLNSLADFISRT